MGGNLVFEFHNLISICAASEVEKSIEELSRMDARIAEGLVRKWQSIKSLAFGPEHCLAKLPEVRMFHTCTY